MNCLLSQVSRIFSFNILTQETKTDASASVFFSVNEYTLLALSRRLLARYA